VYTFGLLLLIVVVLEFLLRADFVELDYNMVGIHVVLDEFVLYRVKPNSDAGINNFGFRDSDFDIDKGSVGRILFFGDSFIMGLNVNSEYTIPSQLEKKVADKFEVYNMGVHGYGPDQSLLQLQQFGEKFKPEIVVFSVFADNDFNDLYKNRLFSLDDQGDLKKNKGNLVTESLPVLRTKYLYDYLNFFKRGVECLYLKKLFSDLFYDNYDDHWKGSHEKFLIMEAVLKEVKKVTDNIGSKLLVLVIPSDLEVKSFKKGNFSITVK